MSVLKKLEPYKESALNTLDELIRRRALDSDQYPLIAYPKTRLGVDDYELFTGKDLNKLVDGAAKHLIKSGFPPVVRYVPERDQWN